MFRRRHGVKWPRMIRLPVRDVSNENYSLSIRYRVATYFRAFWLLVAYLANWPTFAGGMFCLYATGLKMKMKRKGYIVADYRTTFV